MRTKRFARRSGSGLTPGVVDVLLGGWSGPAGVAADDDPFLVFTLTDGDLRQLWQEHRADLLTEAKRRGIAEPWAATLGGASNGGLVP